MTVNPMWRVVSCAMLACLGALVPAAVMAEEPASWVVYIGTLMRGENLGIYRSVLDATDGSLSEPELAAETTNPSFLAIHPSRRFLYAVGEAGLFEGKPVGGVVAFAIDADTGMLTKLNAQSSEGRGPCHLVVDDAGRNVLVANYGGGSVAVLPIGPDGRLQPASAFVQHEGSSVNSRRQTAPHAHSINLDPANRFAFVADLGLDQVRVYQFSSDAGTLRPHDPPFAKVAPGAGPRHFAFHPSGRFAYVINELDCTITAFAYDAGKGRLHTLLSVTTLPADFDGDNTTAEIVAHPSGKFVYGSNRGHDSIAGFRIDQETGRLTPIGHTLTGGQTPRNFAIDPVGRFLLAQNQASDSVVVFRIDPGTGALEPTGSRITVPSPVCIRMMPIQP